MAREKVLVLGGGGFVGSRYVELSTDVYDLIIPKTRDQVEQKTLIPYVQQSPAPIVVNFAAIANVDESQREDKDESGVVYQMNAQLVKDLAETCKKEGKYFVHISTDYIFDGNKDDSPYAEQDKAHPLNWYGQTKYLGELYFLDSGCHGVIARIEMPYRAQVPMGMKKGFLLSFYDNLREGKKLTTLSDTKITPVFADDAITGINTLIAHQSTGIYHLASSDFTTPFDVATLLADKCGLDKGLINPVPFADFTRLAPRPKNSWLDTTKFRGEFGEGILHTVDQSLLLFKSQIEKIIPG